MRTAKTQATGTQDQPRPPSAPTNTRTNAANAAAFVAAAMNPVTGVGAPWYTSGVHMWNGTTAVLKPNPTSNSATEASTIEVGASSAANAAPTRATFVVPATPYATAMPYSSSAEENAPRMKYLNAASWLSRSRRAKAVRMYSDSDRISIEMKTMMRSAAEASSVIPVAANSSRG